MPIIIEFVGFAGSGKTFIREQLINTFGEESIVPADIKLSISDVISYTLKNPFGVLYTIMFIISTRQNNVKQAITYVKNILRYRIKLFKSIESGKKYVIVDEGIVHRLRMIRSTSNKSGLSYDTIKPRYRKDIFSHADIIVYVVAPLKTIAQRRLYRKKRITNESSIKIEISKIKDEVMIRNQDSEYDIIAAMKEHKFHYIKVNNDHTVSINDIIDRIKECASNLSEARLMNRTLIT